jgi:hypothetical protein
MTNENSGTTMERKHFSNHYASRLLNRVLSDRKKADDKLNPADAAKFEVHHKEQPVTSVK